MGMRRRDRHKLRKKDPEDASKIYFKIDINYNLPLIRRYIILGCQFGIKTWNSTTSSTTQVSITNLKQELKKGASAND